MEEEGPANTNPALCTVGEPARGMHPFLSNLREDASLAITHSVCSYPQQGQVLTTQKDAVFPFNTHNTQPFTPFQSNSKWTCLVVEKYKPKG